MSRTFQELAPQNFSFNSPLGWCPACDGLGVEVGTDQSVIVANPNLTLRQGAISAFPKPNETPTFLVVLEALCNEMRIPLDTPWYQLTPQHQRFILQGTGERTFSVVLPGSKVTAQLQYKGLYPAIEEATRVSYPYRAKLQDLVGERPCSVCNGERLRDDAAAVQLNGKTLPQLCQLPLNEVLEFLSNMQLTKAQQNIAGDLLDEGTHRLKFLVDVGLDYLTLDRSMPTLSGGESQRIRLAGQIGRALTGVLYVLDEPTIGLHPRDNTRLIEALHKLRDLGNTLVLVEHDKEVIEASDQLFDFGPASGRFGGNITDFGTPAALTKSSKNSLTGQYLSGEKGIRIPDKRRMVREDNQTHSPHAQFTPEMYNAPLGGSWLTITGCRQNNLQDVDFHIPLGTMTCVTGLSGSGKSSLVQETLSRAVARHLRRQGPAPGAFDTMTGAEQISRVISVDQSPLGATPASNPATYTGVFDPIRILFTKLPDAKIRGYKPGRFSFNRAGGRCDDCEGMGQKKIEMHFLPDVWVECDTCHGKRYNQETLVVKYKGHSIADVLQLSIGQALELFENIPKIRAPLATLDAIGLNYLTLGQSATTLSGGEAQRVKLAAELAKPNSGRTLYLLDEPTTGLHFDDIAKLLKVLNSLVEQGNSVVIIEHNLDVIKTADWIVDVGPEAGVGGGHIVVSGTPEEVVAHADSYTSANGKLTTKKRSAKTKQKLAATDTAPMRSWTGELLKPILEQDQRGEIEFFDVKAAAKKQTGDLDIAKVGADIAAPWQVNGRDWHTHSRIARNGKACAWEGAALEYVVDLLSKHKGLKEANWNDQARVEITSKKKAGAGWFFHALTGDQWLLRLYFRVPKGSFEEADLQQRIKLKSVNELNELPIYNRSDRVRTNQSKGPFQEVIFDIHWKEEIDTPEFQTFLNEAATAYLGQVNKTDKLDVSELTPWKVLGKKWHTSRKGFPSNKRVAWNAEVIEKLFELLESAFASYVPDWGNKTGVTWKDSAGNVVAELQSKRRDGIYLSLLSEPGTFALGQVATFGKDREIIPHRSGREAIKIKLTAQSHVANKEFQQFLDNFVST